jgi:hypothetical protein
MDMKISKIMFLVADGCLNTTPECTLGISPNSLRRPEYVCAGGDGLVGKCVDALEILF